MSLFADDAKIMRRVKTEDYGLLQRDMDKVWEWNEKWEMELNVKSAVLLNSVRVEEEQRVITS